MKLINADKVIEKLKEHKSLFCKNRYEFRALSDKDKARVDEIDTCIAELVNAEEVQTTEPDSDTISRAKAIEALRKLYITEPKINNDYSYDMALDQAEDAIKQLPPAQPERIKARWLPIGMADAVGGESAMWGDEIAYHACDNCWQQALEKDGEEVLSDFCPNCGAEMDVTE